MNLFGIAIGDSPDHAGWTRLSAQVRYDNDSTTEALWYDVPSEHAVSLSVTGDPWLVVLAPLAFTLREPLRIGAPVDATLLEGVRSVLETWHRWYPQPPPIDVDVDKITPPTVRSEDGRNALFFSGGVDSFATLLHDRALASPRIDDLLLVHGADIPLEDLDSFNRVLDAVQSVGRSLGASVIPLRTNVRKTRFSRADYPTLSFGAMFASMAHVLGGRFACGIMPAGLEEYQVRPWGSHPETDPFLSSSVVRIDYLDLKMSRVEKTRLCAESPVARDVLRVCWRGRGSKNCGRCEKCYRTMATLDLFGRLKDFRTFNETDYVVRRIGRLLIFDGFVDMCWDEIIEAAEDKGRPDVARYACLALRRSRRIYKPLRRMAGRLERLHLVWPMGKAINACLDSYFIP